MKNKIIIITGGSSGLGLAIAKKLVTQAPVLILIGRDKKKLELACNEVLSVNSQASVLGRAVDVTSQQSVTELFEEIGNTYGRVDMLINSAGILKEGYFETLSMDTFRSVMEINFFGILNMIKTFLPLIRQAKGRIINISSVAGLQGVFGYSAYCSAKYALNGFTEALRYEMKPQEISVQLVCPSEFKSPMVDALNSDRTPENRLHTLTIPECDIETIVREILSGIDKKSFIIIPGFMTRLFSGLVKFFPNISRMFNDRRIKTVYKGPEQDQIR